MPLGILFWVVYVIAILFGLWSNYDVTQPLWIRRAGAYMVLWLLVGVLGWEVFGPVVRR
jgi:membrane protein YdbS with pleckstrin-like domain